jgi:hypothetical protein
MEPYLLFLSKYFGSVYLQERRFWTTPKRGASKLLAFVENKRGCLVESLVLRTTFPDRSDDIDVVSQIANTLPAGVYKLLADLQQFPRLRELTTDLPLTFHGLLSCEENMDRIYNPGSWDWWQHLHETGERLAEPPVICRTLTPEAYDVLSLCMINRITSLRIKNSKARDASGFRSKACRKLLRQLQRFEL